MLAVLFKVQCVNPSGAETWTIQHDWVNSSSPGQNGPHFADIFKCIFMNEKFCVSIWISQVCSQGCNWQHSRIGSGNGLALTRRQAIILTNANPVHRRIYATLGGDELIPWLMMPRLLASPGHQHTYYWMCVRKSLCCPRQWVSAASALSAISGSRKYSRRKYIQSSASLTRSNIVRYYINNYRNWGRISIRCWIHNGHPIPHPNGQAMGWLLWIFVRKLTT